MGNICPRCFIFIWCFCEAGASQKCPFCVQTAKQSHAPGFGHVWPCGGSVMQEGGKGSARSPASGTEVRLVPWQLSDPRCWLPLLPEGDALLLPDAFCQQPSPNLKMLSPAGREPPPPTSGCSCLCGRGHPRARSTDLARGLRTRGLYLRTLLHAYGRLRARACWYVLLVSVNMEISRAGVCSQGPRLSAKGGAHTRLPPGPGLLHPAPSPSAAMGQGEV